MHQPEDDPEAGDVGYFKAGVMSFIAIVLGVWMPNFISSLIYSNNKLMFGDHGKMSNFLFCKYYITLKT